MTATNTEQQTAKKPPRLTLERARRIVQLLDLDGGSRG